MIEESEYDRRMMLQRQAKLRAELEREGVPSIRIDSAKQAEVIHISYQKKSETQIYLLMQYLTLLKTQLPSMPHHHLISVLFSPSHENLLLLDEKNLLAGLSFNHIEGKRAFELSLMAASESSKGYGAILVNHLKSLAQIRKIKIIATHADNSAIGFYQKMGFSMVEYTENKVLGEKEFSNSTMMQTRVSGKINYGQVRSILKKQKEYLLSSLKPEGLQMSEAACNDDLVLREERFRLNPIRLEGVGNFWQEYKQIKSSPQHIIYKEMVSQIDRLIEMADPWLVEMPSQLLQLTFLVYDKPIELMNIKESAIAGKYETNDDFMEDLRLFLANCRKFYASNPRVSQSIDALQQEIGRMVMPL